MATYSNKQHLNLVAERLSIGFKEAIGCLQKSASCLEQFASGGGQCYLNDATQTLNRANRVMHDVREDLNKMHKLMEEIEKTTSRILSISEIGGGDFARNLVKLLDNLGQLRDALQTLEQKLEHITFPFNMFGLKRLLECSKTYFSDLERVFDEILVYVVI